MGVLIAAIAVAGGLHFDDGAASAAEARASAAAPTENEPGAPGEPREIPVGSTPTGIVASPDGSGVWVANAGSNSLSLIDAATGRVTRTIAVPVSPVELAIAADGRTLYVSPPLPVGVLPVDTVSGAVGAPIAGTGDGRAIPLALSPDGRELYRPNHEAGTVSVIDTTTNSVVGAVPTGGKPFSVAFAPDGTRAYVTDDDGAVTVVETATGAVSRIPLPGVRLSGIAVSPDGSAVFVTRSDGTIAMIDGDSHALSGTLSTGATYLYGVAVSPDGSRVYAAGDTGLVVIDLATGGRLATPAVPGMLGHLLAVAPDGRAVYVTDVANRRVVEFAAPRFGTIAVPGGTVGVEYRASVAVAGGVRPVTYSATGLPPGLRIDPANGAVSGVPEEAGAALVVVTAGNPVGTDTVELTVGIAAADGASGGGDGGEDGAGTRAPDAGTARAAGDPWRGPASVASPDSSSPAALARTGTDITAALASATVALSVGGVLLLRRRGSRTGDHG